MRVLGLPHEVYVLRSRLHFLVRDRLLPLALTFGVSEVALVVVNRFIKSVVLRLQLSPPLLAFTKAVSRVGATSGISWMGGGGRGAMVSVGVGVTLCAARPK